MGGDIRLSPNTQHKEMALSNWTEIERLKARVGVLEEEVAELKARRQRRSAPEVLRGDWIPLTEVDMHADDKRARPPVAIRFPDGTEAKLGSWKAIRLAIADFKGVDDWLRDVMQAAGTDRHVSMGIARQLAGDNAAEYALAFPLNDK